MPGSSAPGPVVPQVDVAILTALAHERDAIVEAIGNCVADPAQSLHLGDIAGQRILVFLAGKGNVRAAHATQRVIGTWAPQRLILAGIAGGAPGSTIDMRPGDVLVPDQVVGYELAKVTADGTSPRYQAYRPDRELLDRAISLRATDWASGIVAPRPGDPNGRMRPLIHTGTVLVGDKVVADSSATAALRRVWPEAIGIEMESLGVALAAYQNGIGFLVVKAVSDFADAGKNDDWQRYAAAAAARFTVAVLAGFPMADQEPLPGPARAAGKQGQSSPRAGSGRSARGPATPEVGMINNFHDFVNAEVIGNKIVTGPGEQP
jgi:adenosylhomocysteine nucleosidase